MSDRRAALIGRFRAGAIDRIRQIAGALIEIEDGRGEVERVREIGRELHSLKGEARMLKFAGIAEVAHASEQLLVAGEGELPGKEACRRVGRALEAVSQALKAERSPEEMDPQLVALLSELRTAGGAREVPASRAPAIEVVEAGGAVAEPTSEVFAAPAAPERWVQVSAARIDHLCEGVAEFMAEFRALFARFRTAAGAKPGEAQRALLDDFDRCRVQLDELSGSTWALRLVPVEPTLDDLGKHARELAGEQQKRLRCVVDAGGAQVERAVLDALWEPLVHLVRNAVDHGIEAVAERGDKGPEARLELHAETVGGTVVITISDDGRGVDCQKVRGAAVARGVVTAEAAGTLDEAGTLELLFSHGFSTREEVTDVSGRGVGLDVVRSVAESLGGAVSIASELGRGTRFALSIPVTVSTERVLVFEVGGGLYGLPARQVRAVVAAEGQATRTVAGGRALRYDDEAIPLRSLSAALSVEETSEPRALIVEAGRRWALSVPRVLGEFELVRRPVDAAVASLGLVSASMMLDDGRLVLLLALGGVLRRDDRAAPARSARRAERKARVLVVDDSAIVRDVVGHVLAGAGFDVADAADGALALIAIEGRLPDVVVADVDMPNMDGFELLQRLRVRFPTLPVIIHTTRGSAEDRKRAAALGADAFLAKSEFQEAELVATVRRFAGASS